MYCRPVSTREPLNLAWAGWLARTKAVELPEGRRDSNDPMMTIRISLPSLDRIVRDKDVDPEPRDKVEAPCLRAVHVIPGNLHPIRRVIPSPVDMPPSELWLMRWR